MRNTLLFVCLAVMVPTMALAADSHPIGVYPVERVDEGAITVDGRLDDAAWENAPLVSGFVDFETRIPCEVQTAFRVVYDDRYLYFGVHCDEPDMERLTPVRVPRDEHAIFRGETVEVFIDPHHTHDLYYQIVFNAAGSLYDGMGESTVWNSNALIETHLGEDFWSAELAIPWSSLGEDLTPGRLLGFNVNRNRHLGISSQWMTWAIVESGFHDPVRFAHLVLAATPEMIVAMSDELRKGGRSGPIRIYSAEGFSQQTYSQLAQAALADLDQRLAELDEERKREPNPAAAAELDRRLTQYREQIAQLRRQADDGLDGANWSRLDVEMRRIVGELRKVIWDTRLDALLNSL